MISTVARTRFNCALVFLSAIALFFALMPATALAMQDGDLEAQASDLPMSGMWGTCAWDIDSAGTLTIHPGNGADTHGKSPWEGYNQIVNKVVFVQESGKKVVAPLDSSALFKIATLSWDNSIEFIDLTGLDTSRVTDMSEMFWACCNLTALDVSKLNTTQVRDMAWMFYGCLELASLDVSNFNTSQVRDMSFMFCDCGTFNTIDVSSFNTSNVTNMSHMFSGELPDVFNSFTHLDLSNFDTSKVTNMAGMFYCCYSLSSLDVSGFDTSQVQNMSEMFYCCPLSTLNLSSFDTSRVTEMWDILEGCTKLTSISLGERFSFKGASSTVQATLPEAEWRSANDKRVYTAQQIAESRGNIADTYSLIGNPSGTQIDGSDDMGSKVMYRLYNPNSGEHFYTADAGERDAIAGSGWTYEGEAWTAPVKSETPVYRLYSGTDHHYTTSLNEKDELVRVGWSYEGIGWYSDDAKGVGLHRLYNPYVDPTTPTNNSGSHHYTTDSAEKDALIANGWVYEDYGWYGVK